MGTISLLGIAVDAEEDAYVAGLKTKTTYYFQFVVSTAAGTVSGPVLSFTTD